MNNKEEDTTKYILHMDINKTVIITDSIYNRSIEKTVN